MSTACLPPRLDYESVYLLLPPDATAAWSTAAMMATVDRKITVAYSADDAGCGAPRKRIIILNPDRWPDSIHSFFESYYPGVALQDINAISPLDAFLKLCRPLPSTDVQAIALSQNDLRWKNQPLGNSTATIGKHGCLLVSLAMLLRKAYGTDILPDRLNDLLVLLRQFAGGLLHDWGGIVRSCSLFDRSLKENRPYTPSEVRNFLQQGWLVVVANPTLQHFAFAVDATARSISVIDPTTGLLSRWQQTGGVRAAHLASQPLPPTSVPTGKPARGAILTMHLESPVPGWKQAVLRIGPRVVKTLSLDVAIEVIDSGIPVVFRPYFDHYRQQEIIDAGPGGAWTKFRESANWALQWLRNYPDVWVETLNETFGSGDPARVQRVVQVEVALARALAQEGFRPILLNIPVGNPSPGEYELLLPAAEASVQLGGAIGYHSYWPVRAGDGLAYLGQWWDDYEGRFTKINEAFRRHGYSVCWFLGEAGAVWMNQDGSLDPMGGWRRCYPSIGEFVAAARAYAQRLMDWEAQTGQWVLGASLFTSNIFGTWEHFQVHPDDYVAIAGGSS